MENIDLAQIAIWLFWVFFAGLVWYLHREDKREGYPLHTDRDGVTVEGFPAVPEKKVYHTSHAHQEH